eukprot:scpid60508/ scgid5098/ Zinc finger BED domain-containing protein 1; Putative Ac-like transposable element; dREF homolog
MEESKDLDMNPLAWWKVNHHRFPHVAEVARRYLSASATSVPSERVFSSAGLLVNKLRCRLSPAHVDAVIFLNMNKMLRGTRSSAYQSSLASATKATSVLSAVSQVADSDDEEIGGSYSPPFPVLDVSDSSSSEDAEDADE